MFIINVIFSSVRENLYYYLVSEPLALFGGASSGSAAEAGRSLSYVAPPTSPLSSLGHV
jgi:hypothetical protein